MEANKVNITEKEKRKEIARKRTFWFLALFNVLLMVYIFIQIVILVSGK